LNDDAAKLINQSRKEILAELSSFSVSIFPENYCFQQCSSIRHLI
jgi:hypothetical protein